MEAIIRSCSANRVTRSSWDYLEELRVYPHSHVEAYQCLAAILGDEQREGRLQQGVTRLRTELRSNEEWREEAAAKWQRVHRLMR